MKSIYEMVFGESCQIPVETRYMSDVTDFMKMNDIKYQRLGNYYLPGVGRFWIVELYSAGSIAASAKLVNDELWKLREWKEEKIGERS